MESWYTPVKDCENEGAVTPSSDRRTAQKGKLSTQTHAVKACSITA